MASRPLIDDRDELLASVSLYELLVERGCEPRGSALRCPLPDHEDHSASASYTEGHAGSPELWFCHRCGVGGTAIDLLVQVEGLDVAEAFAALRDRVGGHHPPPVPVRRASARRKPSLPSEQQIAAWARALAADDQRLSWLAEERGWSADVLARYDVGVHERAEGVCSHRDRRVSIPVRDASGALVGLVCFQPDKRNRSRQNPKTKAAGERELFPAPEAIDDRGGWTVLCEGEPDALCGLSLGLAVVSVPGTGKWSHSWEQRFAGRRVLVVGDCDTDGRSWAQRTASALVSSAAEVRVADLAPSRDDGYDLTDWTLDQRDGWAGDPAALAASVDALVEGAHRVGMDAVVDPADALQVRRFSRVPSRTTRWLWQDLIPVGSLSALAGRQGIAKSLWSCDLAARASRGELAGDLAGEPITSLMISYEDDPEATIRPRLEAAGADLDQVATLDGSNLPGNRTLALPSHTDLIASVIRREGVRLLILDPVGAALAADVNSHRDSDVRSALAPLAALAAREQIAVLLIMHRRKGYADEPLDAVMGSTGFTAAPRSVLLFGRCPDDPEGDQGAYRVLAHAKNNLGALQPSRRLRIEPVTLPGAGEDVNTARIVDAGESRHDAQSLTREARARRGEPVADAVALLEEMLSDGPRLSREVHQRAEAEGIKRRTMERAKLQLGVINRPRHFQGPHELSLPQAGGENTSLF